MPKYSYFTVISIAFLAFTFFVAGSSPFDITFPIPELGNCVDKAACKAYCDDLSHKNECVEFAKKHGLISESEAVKAKELPPAGPGGCGGQEECRSYCDDPTHLDECVAFAEEHGLASEEEIKRAKEFKGQTGPGGCRGANECRSYCEDPAHREECLEFGHRKGLISDRDRDVAQRVLKEGGPGGCRSESECRAYCEDPVHIDECLAFAEEHGFVQKEEAARLKKLGFASGPGGCKGEAQCREFCENPANQLLCIDWAADHGLMTEEQAAMARKLAGKTGPGGCRGNQCREFCENPDNAEACVEFASREGILPPEELERAKKFVEISRSGGPGGCRGIQCRDYCENPANQDECFSFAKNQGLISKEEERRFEAGARIGKVVEEKGGPGGCRSDDECRAYCTDPARVEECIAFGAAHGGLPEEEVRKMLKDFQQSRFEAHFEVHGEFGPPVGDFRRFEEEGRKRFEEFRQLEEHFRGGPGFGSPAGFPGGERGAPPGGSLAGAPAFVGPGGCASPQECIKYCSEHKKECFSFGPPGEPGRRPPEGGIPPGHEFPRLRGELKIEFKHDDLPEGFEQLPEEQKRELFKRKFEGYARPTREQCAREGGTWKDEHGGYCQYGEGYQDESGPPFEGRQPSGGFPGRPPGGFPGRPGEFPGIKPEGFEHFPSNAPIPGTPGIFGPFPQPVNGGAPSHEGRGPIPGTPGILPPPEVYPPEGTYPSRSPEGIITSPPPTTGTFTPPPPSESTFTSPPPTTVDPAAQCVQEGGTWNGSYCQFPEGHTEPPHSKAPSRGFFATIFDFFR